MIGFNKGKSEETLKEKKKKYNGKEAVQCQPVSWEEWEHQKECEQEKKERGKYDWDRPLVDETWAIDDEKPEMSTLERNIINSTIMSDEELLIKSEKKKTGGVPYMKPGQESIYDKFAREDKELEQELSGKLDAVGSMAGTSAPERRAIQTAVDQKIIIQSEELKNKRVSAKDAKEKKKVRRRIPKDTKLNQDTKENRKIKADKDISFGLEKPEDKKYQPSKFREKSANWKDTDTNLMLDGEGMGFSDSFRNFFGRFAHYSPLQWATVIMAIIIFFTGITTTAVYANYQSEQNKAVAISNLGKFEEEDTQVVEAMVVDQEMPLAAEEAEVTTGKVLSLVLTSVEKDLKIKLVDENDTLVRGVPWSVTVTNADGKTSDNEDDDEDGIIHLTDVSAGDYSVQINPSDALNDYVLPAENQTVSVKAKVEYKVIQNIKDEIKSEKEVNAAVEDANGNQAADVETGVALADTVEWVESTKTVSGETYVESAVVLTNTAKLEQRLNGVVAALKSIGTNAQSSVLSNGVLALPVLLSEVTPSSETGPTTPDSPEPTEPTPTVTKHNVSVTNGSGAGEYEEGASVTVTANAPQAGQQFKSWTFSGVSADTASTSVTFAMPANDVSATANYENVAIAKSCTLTAPTGLTAKGSAGKVSYSGENIKSVAGYASGNTAVATIDGSGNVTPLTAGTTEISATVTYNDDTTDTVKCTVTVGAEAVTASIKLSAQTASIKVGATAAITATAAPADNVVTWKSSNEAIAKVSNGTITGVTVGTATITATGSKGGSATVAVTVTAADVPTLTLSGTASVAVGAATKITAAVVPTTTTVTFTSSDTSVATVSASGLVCTVTGVKAGSTKLTAKGSNGKTAELTITVTGDKYLDTAQLYDKDKNALYVYENNAYRLAKYADYKSGRFNKYYKKVEGYLYTGWQTIDGKTYYYKKDNTYVTGEQVIAGVKYNFATDGSLTKGSGTLGIDVSKYQPSINWASVKASGVSYAIIRCGYRGSSTGALIQDPYFTSHMKGAKAAGLKVGVYFFTTALSEAEAVEEASMCAALCSGYGVNYPVFMDVESSNRPGFNSMSAAQRTSIIQAFCNTVKSAGYTPGVYANKTWLTSYMNASALSSYKIWLAQYNAAGPTYTGRYDLWQYTSKGSVNGISGNVDMNQSYLGY